jgi:ABC-type multidrug transport system fused ATPase/permease subunit
MKVLNFFRGNLLHIYSLFDRRGKKQICFTLLLQFLLSFLDLAGIAMIGIIGVIGIRGVTSVQPSETTLKVLEWLQIDAYSLQVQTLVLGSLATIFFVFKTYFSIFLTGKFLRDLSKAGAEYSTNVVSKILNQTVTGINQNSFQRIAFAVTTGIEKLFFGVVGPLLIAFADLFLLLVIFVALILVNPFLAFFTYFIFIFSGFLIYRALSKKAARLGRELAENQIESFEALSQAVLSFREMVVQNRRGFYARKISSLRRDSLRISSEYAIMPSISKYLVEAVLILGIFALCALEFLLHDAARAVGMIAIFLAASSRMSPAVLRIQQNLIQIKNSMGQAVETFKLIDNLDETQFFSEHFEHETSDGHFTNKVVIKDVNFRYPNAETESLKGVTLEIEPGEFVALVGSSGAGKSTLVDLILGLLKPNSGEVLISNLPPMLVYKLWPGSVSYVSQDTQIFDCSIAENVTLGFELNDFAESEIWEALRKASLADFVETLPEGIHTQVGDRGAKLSGGQRQRLGIARALITKPLILVLDEATSALDAETEVSVSEAINSLRGNTTLIVVAHRLSSVRQADKVILMRDGKIQGIGTFDELKAISPDFDRQAQLMGL